MKETRIKFQIQDKKYVFIIKKFFLRSKKFYLMEDTKRVTTPIQTEISTSTLQENIEYWLYRLEKLIKKSKRYLIKKCRNL